MDPNQQPTPAPVAAEPTPAAPPIITEPSEDGGWDEAGRQFQAEKGLDPGAPTKPAEEPKTPDAPAEPTKPAEEPKKPEVDPNETPEQKAEREKQEAEAAANKEEELPASDPAARQSRQAQRELAEDRKATIAEIKEKMFPDLTPEILDADGDPVRTVEDVMRLMNPNTNQPFTAEEATIYLFQKSRQVEKEYREKTQQIEEIAETNLSLKDQSENIRDKYGALLKAFPDLRAELWADYSETLVKDEKTGIIIKAPVSLERFYERTLKPWAAMAAKLQADEDAKVTAKTEQQTTHRQIQADRTDVIGSSKTDTMDEEEREWADAAKVVYGEKR